MTMLRASVALVVLLGTPGFLRAQCTGCPAASFGPAAPDFDLGGDPRVLSTADFNGDGLLDIVAGHGGGSGTILLGLPGGRFGPPVSPGSVFRADSLAVADFNGDARSDIAFAGDLGFGISFGRGDGTFAPSVGYPAGDFPRSLAIGDLDGDARVDVVVSINGGFSVLLNRGDGRFSPPQVADQPALSGPPLLADFNEDGNLDVLLNAYFGEGQLFLGNGDGTFSSTPLIAPFAGVRLAADFDRDGHLDIARAAPLDISYGNGDGTFDAPISIAPISGSSLASADFDRDGWPDLIATAHPGRVDLFLSDGIGGFESVRSFALGQTATVTAADFDRDGVPDAVVGYASSPMLTLLRGDSNGSLMTAPSLPVIARALATADFNGDTKTDLAAGGNGVSVWTGDGSGQFLLAYTDGVPVDVQAVAAGDLNGDGKADFVSAEGIGFLPQTGALRVFLGDGAASFVPLAAQNLDFAPRDLGIGNLDGSGGLDLVLTTNTGVHVLFGQGDGTFTIGPILDAVRFYQRLILRDFDGDAALDIAATSSHVSVWLGNGSGAFSAPTEYVLQGNPYEIAAGDFNGDGELDLLTGNLYSSLGYSLLRGRGDGTFEPSFSFPLNFATFGLSTLDFDSDGTLDLAVSDYYGDLLLARGSGKGTFTASNRYAIGGPTGRSIAGDWNGDGKTDLAVTGGSGVGVLLNTNCTSRRLGVMVQSATCAAPGAAFSPQPAVSAMDDGGNVVSCTGGSVTASLVPGTGSVGAVLAGTTTKPLVSGTAAFTNLSINLPGPRYELQFQHSVAGAVRGRPISIHAPYAVGITGPSAACSATLADFSADAGFDGYLWLVDGVERGAGRSFSPFGLPPGPHTIEVRATKEGCSATASRPVTSSPGGPACALSFFTLPPCRLLDTRASEAPALTAGIDRVFPTIGNCGIPPTAKAISANVTVTEPTNVGHLTLFPTGGAFPATSVLNFSAGQTRANNAVLTLGLGRDITVRCTQLFGSAHVILDVNGYFE